MGRIEGRRESRADSDFEYGIALAQLKLAHRLAPAGVKEGSTDAVVHRRERRVAPVDDAAVENCN
jgi:hypothetical protein